MINSKITKYLTLTAIFWCIVINTLVWGNKLHQPYRFKSITVNENLSHSDVLCLAQDSMGYIWIGTNNGLNKYDGYRIITYKYNVNDPQEMPGNRIQSLLVDRSGRIWVFIENQGLFRFHPEEMVFHEIDLPFHHIISDASDGLALIIDDIGDVWVNQKPFGLGRYLLNESGDITDIITYPKEHITPSEHVEINEIKYGSGKLYCLLSNNTIHLYNEESNTFHPVEIPNFSLAKNENMNSIYPTDNHLWVATNQSLVRVEIKGDVFTNHIAYSFKYEFGERIDNLFEDNTKNIWIGTNKGTYLLDQGYSRSQLSELDFRKIFKYDNSCFLEDSFGVLWIGNIGVGVFYTHLKRKPFSHLYDPASSDNIVTSIYRDKSDKVLMGTRTGLVIFSRNNKNGDFEIQSRHMEEEYISFIFRDSRGLLWIGSKFGGLYKANLQDRGLELVSTNQLLETNSNRMYNLMRIAEDRQGRLWVSTFLRGLFIIDIEHNSQIQYVNNPRNPNSISSNKLTDVYCDPLDGAMWISTRDAGLNRVSWSGTDDFQWESFKYDPTNIQSISSNHAWQIMRDRKKRLWLGTLAGGLNQVLYDTASGNCQFIRYTTDNGLPDNDIEALAEDDQGNIWISGVGLCRFNPETKIFEKFDYQDGLQSNSFKVGAVFKDDQGVLYFGGINGINYFVPGEISPETTLPKVYITKVNVNNKKTNTPLSFSLVNTNSITLNSTQNDLSISFVGLQFNSPEKNQYKYQLVGYDQEWNNTTYPNLTANYLNMPPGRYTFRVKVSNSDGVWNEKLAMLDLYIQKPWYGTVLAFIIYAILIGIGLVLYRRFTLKQLSLKNELILAEKEHELDRSKLSFFTKISHELRSPLTLIKSPLEDLLNHSNLGKQTTDRLKIMYRSTNRLLNLTNQLLEFRKMETGNMQLFTAEGNFVKFCKELFLIFSQSTSNSSIDYQFHSVSEFIKLTYDRNKMETVMINLLSNAYKHTHQEGQISIHLSVFGDDSKEGIYENEILVENYLEIKVNNNGPSIPSSELEKIFNPYYQVKNSSQSNSVGTGIGLSLVSGIVKLHKGEVSATNSNTNITSFIIKLPFGKNHLPKNQVNTNFHNSEHIEHYLGKDKNQMESKRNHPKIYLDQINDHNKKYKLLIVEDNLELREYMQQVLESEFIIEVAGNGKEGYEMTLEYLPDLVISDVMMPVLDGIGMCEKLKSNDLTAHIPIVLLTARTSQVYESNSLEIGAEDYITKPFSVTSLKSKLVSILKNREYLKEYYRKQLFFESTSDSPLNREEKLVFKAIQLVEAHLEDINFDVGQLAEELYLSQSNLYRKIKMVTGKSVVEFIRDVRLKNAAQLLREGELSVTEVAYKVGFSSVKYFRKCFKKLYQLNPSEFRDIEVV